MKLEFGAKLRNTSNMHKEIESSYLCLSLSGAFSNSFLFLYFPCFESNRLCNQH